MNSQKLLEKFATDVNKLGPIGTISYVGGILCFISAFFFEFSGIDSKGFILVIIGASLVIFAGLLSSRETNMRALNRKEALGVLREVYNRLAEQSTKGNKEQTVSITMTIAELPKRILEVLHDL